MVEISIKACKSGGIDTKVHGINVLGRVDTTKKDVTGNFSFLTVEDSFNDEANNLCHKRRNTASAVTNGSKVFVWGLNDMHQLGNDLTDRKVCANNFVCITDSCLCKYTCTCVVNLILLLFCTL